MTIASRIRAIMQAFGRYAEAIEVDPLRKINQRLERLEAEVFASSTTNEETS